MVSLLRLDRGTTFRSCGQGQKWYNINMKILFITLTNIGDAILTTPIIDILHTRFPSAKIFVLCGERAGEIFENDPYVYKIIPYNKKIGLKRKACLVFNLFKQRFDLVVDLRNSLIPYLVFPKRFAVNYGGGKKNIHSVDRSLEVLKKLKLDTKNASLRVVISKQNEKRALEILNEYSLFSKRFICICPGAKSSLKRYPEDSFSSVADNLTQMGFDIVLLGEKSEKHICENILSKMKNKAFDLSGQADLKTSGAVLKKSRLVISNDTALMHLANALNVPVLGIFGPTDAAKYGPRGGKAVVVRSMLNCSPCEKAQCPLGKRQCMESISPEDIINACIFLLNS